MLVYTRPVKFLTGLFIGEIMKLLHLADTHLLNLKRHDEFKAVFNEIYRIAKEEKVDVIVHCGDIAHTKTQISPEFVEMAGDFFKNLQDIAPTYIILGNHDTNLKNDSRQDAITPIIKALNLKNLHLLKYSGEVYVNELINFNVLSRIDETKWKKPTNKDKINIALYHGAISGAKTDTGYILENGEHNIDALEGHDFAFLGDIHQSNQILDADGRVRYPGSTVQGNFGEFDDKGFLIWDIKSKDIFDCKHHIIPNPKPYVSIELNEDGNLPDFNIKKGSRVRLLGDKTVPLEKSKKAIDIIKTFEPESVTYVNKSKAKDIKNPITGGVNNENLRDLAVQERLIKDYLKDYKPKEETITKVLELNKKYSSVIEETDEIYRNIKWKLKSLEWDNLFNYADGNKINFEKLNGIVGIFGKNYSGKSSIVDSILYTTFNTTSKNNRKNLNVINQNKEKGFGRMEVDINGETYSIERESTKYTKKTKGVEITEAKTEVEFTSDAGSLNGLARTDTDKTIRKYFGNVDDFFLTSMSSQFGYLSFISEGSTKRKEILAKFLDLETFEKKFKLAKEESAEIKALLKKLESNETIAEDIKNAKIEVTDVEALINKNNKELIDLKNTLSEKLKELDEITEVLKRTPTKILDIKKLKESYNKFVELESSLKQQNSNIIEENKKMVTLIKKCDEFLNLLDEKEIRDLGIESNTLESLIKKLELEVFNIENNYKTSSHKMKLLDEVPCGNEYPTCKFIKDAFSAKKGNAVLKNNLEKNKDLLEQHNKRFEIVHESFTDKIAKKNQITKKKADSEQTLKLNELILEKNLLNLEKVSLQIQEFLASLEEQEKNTTAINQFHENENKQQNILVEANIIKNNIKQIEDSSIVLYKRHGSATEKILLLEKQKEETEKLRTEFTAYDLYLKCMHPNGISYEIIKKKLPEINSEITKILNNIVNFNVSLENDEDKLDIMIKHPNFEARPLEMGSGAEKTLASTAIRLALISVTSLPVSDIFILDEPGTALDQENLDGFVRILELIKTYFKTVILISHLDYLKDCVDTQITIEKRDGYAYVNQ